MSTGVGAMLEEGCVLSWRSSSGPPVDSPEFSWFAEGAPLSSLLLSCPDAALLPLPAHIHSHVSPYMHVMASCNFPDCNLQGVSYNDRPDMEHSARTFQILTGALGCCVRQRSTGGSQGAAARG